MAKALNTLDTFLVVNGSNELTSLQRLKVDVAEASKAVIRLAARGYAIVRTDRSSVVRLVDGKLVTLQDKNVSYVLTDEGLAQREALVELIGSIQAE